MIVTSLRQGFFASAISCLTAAVSLSQISSAVAQPGTGNPEFGLPLFECVFALAPHSHEGPATFLLDERRNTAYIHRGDLGGVPTRLHFTAGSRAITFVSTSPFGGVEVVTVITAGSDFGRAHISRHFVYSDESLSMRASNSDGRCRHTGQARVPRSSSGLR